MSDPLYTEPLRDPIYGFQKVNVARQMADEDSLLNTIRLMIASYKSSPALAKGKLEWLLDTPKGTLCFRRGEGNDRLIAFHNLTAETHIIPFTEWEVCCDAFRPSPTWASTSRCRHLAIAGSCRLVSADLR